MNIYIDESGIFANPQGHAQALSCVGALVVPTHAADGVLRAYSDLRNKWCPCCGEIKGSDLNEAQVASVVELLGRYDVVFTVAAIDLALHTPDDILSWRRDQEDRITCNLNDSFHPQLISDLRRLRSAMQRLSDPLFIQCVLSTIVVDDVLGEATLYYCQRLPEELGSFNWVLDAKDKCRTRYERVWRQLVLPFLQCLSLRQPHGRLKGGDWSHFEKFMCATHKVPDHLRDYVPDPDGPFLSADIGMIMCESMHFTQSHKDLGVQLADILITSFRRALDRTLAREGWKGLGSLMIYKGNETVRFIGLKPRGGHHPTTCTYRVSYKGIIDDITSSARQMLAHG